MTKQKNKAKKESEAVKSEKSSSENILSKETGIIAKNKNKVHKSQDVAESQASNPENLKVEDEPNKPEVDIVESKNTTLAEEPKKVTKKKKKKAKKPENIASQISELQTTGSNLEISTMAHKKEIEKPVKVQASNQESTSLTKESEKASENNKENKQHGNNNKNEKTEDIKADIQSYPTENGKIVEPELPTDQVKKSKKKKKAKKNKDGAIQEEVAKPDSEAVNLQVVENVLKALDEVALFFSLPKTVEQIENLDQVVIKIKESEGAEALPAELKVEKLLCDIETEKPLDNTNQNHEPDTMIPQTPVEQPDQKVEKPEGSDTQNTLLENPENLLEIVEETSKQKDESNKLANIIFGDLPEHLSLKYRNPKKGVPAIFLHKPQELEPHVRKLVNIGIQFYQPTRGTYYTKLYCVTLDDYREMINYFDSRHLPYHTFANPDKQKIKAVIRGFPLDTDLEKVKDELVAASIPIIRLHKLHTKESIPDHPLLVLAVVHRTPEGKKLWNVKKILGHTVKIEAPNAKTKQCHRCQRWGHSQRYCHGKIKCVKCAGDHFTKKCPRASKIEEPPKCANCGGEHTANYKRCHYCPESVYHQLTLSTKIMNIRTRIKRPEVITLENLNNLYRNVMYIPKRKGLANTIQQGN